MSVSVLLSGDSSGPCERTSESGPETLGPSKSKSQCGRFSMRCQLPPDSDLARYLVEMELASLAPVKPRHQRLASRTKYAFFRLAALRRRPDPGGLRRPRACRGEHLRRRGLGPAGHERAVPPRYMASGAQALDEAASITPMIFVLIAGPIRPWHCSR